MQVQLSLARAVRLLAGAGTFSWVGTLEPDLKGMTAALNRARRAANAGKEQISRQKWVEGSTWLDMLTPVKNGLANLEEIRWRMEDEEQASTLVIGA